MINSSMINKNVQQEIFSKIKDNIKPFLHELITEENWKRIISQVHYTFETFKAMDKLLLYKRICSTDEDFIIEYDISFSESYFMYMHLRNQHLMIKFVPKEF